MSGIVTLVADGHRVSCQKSKLIEASDYFRAMFCNDFTEKDKDVINLEGVDGECLKILVEYAENNCFSISNEGSLALLQTAAMLQFTRIQTICETQVIGSLSIENCLEVYSVTSSIGMTNIAKSARLIALWNFRKISTRSTFLHLSFDALVEYISDPSLITGPNGEWTVWEAINSWIEVDEVERSQFIKKLLSCLDFKGLTADDISNILFYNVISENDEIVQVLEAIKNFKKRQRIKFNQSLGIETQPDESCLDNLVDENSELQERMNYYMNCLSRKPSLCPSVVGYKLKSSKAQKKKAKMSDDEDDSEFMSSKDLADLEPVLYSFNPKTGKLSEEFKLSKLCGGPVHCSGYQVCSVGKF